MTVQQKEQMTLFCETLFDLRKPKDTRLYSRMRYQRWLLRETAQFWPNASLVDVVLEVVAPTMNRHYPN
jgi:hypothetical protein